MLIHLLIIIKNNLRANLLLMAGMFVIATSLWYAVDYVYAVVVNQQKSLGFDWEHVYYVQAAVLPNESVECDTASRSDDEVTAEYLEFYNRLQHHPAVESACYTLMHFHYIWKNGSGTMSYDTLKTSAMYREVTPSYFTVFRVRGADECSPEELSRRASHTNDFVVTENTACRLLNPDINNMTVKGVELAGRFIHSGVSMREDEPDSVRVASNSIPGFTEHFMQDMQGKLSIGPYYLYDINSYGDMKEAFDIEQGTVNYLNTTYAVILFFVFNIFLGMLGTFWFRTRKNRSEIALRMALGCSRMNVFGYYVLEGILLLVSAAIPAVFVCANMQMADLTVHTLMEPAWGRFLLCFVSAMLLLGIIILLGIYFPARKAMRIEPADALHNE